jgi:hypothetical protein
MRFIFISILAVSLAPAFAQAKEGGVGCYDNEHTVEMSAKLNKKNGPYDVRIHSNGRNRLVTKNDITRTRITDVDFYMLFIVQTKNGPEELELDTHYAKSGGDHTTSVGHLTNKTQKSDRLPVTCKFK